MGVFYESVYSKCLGFIFFILQREDVLWAFVQNQISGEVCETSGEHRLTRSFRVSILPNSELSKVVLPTSH